MIPWVVLFSLVATLPTPIPVRLEPTQARQLLGSAGGDTLPQTSDWTLVGPVGDSAVLLADGTQWKKIPWSQVGAISIETKLDTVTGWKGWIPDSKRLLLWGAMPQGQRISGQLNNGKGRSSTSLLDASIHGEIHPQVTSYLSLVAGLGWEKSLFSISPVLLTGDSAYPSGVGMVFGACGPFLCLEIQRHALPLTAESWYQGHLDSLITTKQAGNFWTGGANGPPTSAWERRLTMHLGWLVYRARWCAPLWSGSFQSLGLWDLPAGPVRFGAGLEWTADRAATRFSIASAPIRWTLGSGRGFAVDLVPLSFSMAYRRMGEFQMVAQTEIQFPENLSIPLPWKSR